MRQSLPFAALAVLTSTVSAEGLLSLKHKHWLEDFRREGENRRVDKSNASAVQTFESLIDHFPNDDQYAPHPGNATFKMRWWYNIAHYEKGGPVIFQDPGEGPGSDIDVSESYMPGQLAKQLKGIVVSLEHRYFGDSYPVKNMSTDAMRFLTVQQAMEDSAAFAQWVEIPELKKKGIDIRAPNVPWIVYGGSYPGAKAAFQRVTYPELYYGGIASSAVTDAQWDQWSYFDAPRKHLPPACSAYLVSHTAAIDRLWALNDKTVNEAIAKFFGMSGRGKIQIADSLTNYIGAWQGAGQGGITDGSWNPPKTYGPTLDALCKQATNTTVAQPRKHIPKELLAPLLKIVQSPDPTVVEMFKAADIAYTSTKDVNKDLSSFFAYAQLFAGNGGKTGSDTERHPEDAASAQKNDGRSWSFMVCNQFEYEQTAAPKGVPSLLSRVLTKELFYKEYCTSSFPPGKFYKLPDPAAAVKTINVFGDFGIKSDRLIEVGGTHDPWRGVTPLADENIPNVQNTTGNSPAYIIENAGHCFDFQQPLATSGPWKAPLQHVLDMYISTVNTWLKDWTAPSKQHKRFVAHKSKRGGRRHF